MEGKFTPYGKGSLIFDPEARGNRSAKPALRRAAHCTPAGGRAPPLPHEACWEACHTPANSPPETNSPPCAVLLSTAHGGENRLEGKMEGACHFLTKLVGRAHAISPRNLLGEGSGRAGKPVRRPRETARSTAQLDKLRNDMPPKNSPPD